MAQNPRHTLSFRVMKVFERMVLNGWNNNNKDKMIMIIIIKAVNV